MNISSTWVLWLGLNLILASYFAYAFFAPASPIKTSLLPGKTTHGHYQIEMDCDACHAPSQESGKSEVGAVMQDACNRCHADQLKRANDTHPAKKFNDPTNAELLLTLNAQDCLSCHQEHLPNQTLAMGLTVPADYCWHCHQEVADNRPSHEGMAFDSCATAGCHNYHDNRAIYEKYLSNHFGEPDVLEGGTLPLRQRIHEVRSQLSLTQADAPSAKLTDNRLIDDWAETAHAKGGVNCSGCHQSGESSDWSDSVSMSTCGDCHTQQEESFVMGRHGMRLASGLPPMTPSEARLPMHSGMAHQELTCNACHSGHRFDTAWAATEACLQCHADDHSVAYSTSPHADLWKQEMDGTLPAGSGVSCASCHLPRMVDDDENVWVNHNQNDNLRPNEVMAREVCQKCHGLEFSLSSLADSVLIESCFSGQPEQRTQSVQMAHEWFEQQRLKRERRQKKSATSK